MLVLMYLQHALYCLPIPPIVLLHCWVRNSIANASECMIRLAISLTSCRCIASTLEPLLMVILTLLLSSAKGGPPGLALETVDIQKVQSKILAQHARYPRTPIHYTVTLCKLLLPVYTHFDYVFAIKPYIVTQCVSMQLKIQCGNSTRAQQWAHVHDTLQLCIALWSVLLHDAILLQRCPYVSV